MPEIRMLGPGDDVVLRNVAPGGGIGRAVVQALLQHATRLYASTGGAPGSRDHVMFTYYLEPKEQK